jgi:hypothetical protein
MLSLKTAPASIHAVDATQEQMTYRRSATWKLQLRPDELASGLTDDDNDDGGDE